MTNSITNKSKPRTRSGTVERNFNWGGGGGGLNIRTGDKNLLGGGLRASSRQDILKSRGSEMVLSTFSMRSAFL